jgi:hypothetical protein
LFFFPIVSIMFILIMSVAIYGLTPGRRDSYKQFTNFFP